MTKSMHSTKNFTELVDHTLLKPEAKLEEILALCNEAKEHGFNSVCVRAEWVKEASSQYKCSAVIAFPEEIIQCSSERDLLKAKESLASEDFDLKMLEARKALENGALELDPVLPIKKLDTGDIQEQDELKEELEEYLKIAREFEGKNPDKELFIKPIFSCECLDDEELELSVSMLAELVLEFKADHPDSKIKFAYKNSTGFIKGLGDRLASPELISKIAAHLDLYDPEKIISIKAAGGIKSKEDAERINQVANGRLSHIGTSSGTKLV